LLQTFYIPPVVYFEQEVFGKSTVIILVFCTVTVSRQSASQEKFLMFMSA